jgi:hypothetical protein
MYWTCLFARTVFDQSRDRGRGFHFNAQEQDGDD